MSPEEFRNISNKDQYLSLSNKIQNESSAGLNYN